VFTSNILAILGLRALYFALAGIMELFHYLHYALSFILVFVGVKMLVSRVYHVPTSIALGVITATLATCIVASLVFPKKEER
jgi:tellurite resistance protein TerC